MAGGTPAALWQSGSLAQALDLAAEVKSWCLSKVLYKKNFQS